MQNFKSYIKIFIITALTIVHLGALAFINYAFAHYDEVFVTGGEVKRMDKDGLIDTKNPADGPTRDVYFIYTKEINGTKVMPYRNEDTGWGMPFYFKFNSADVQAMAQSLVGEKRAEIKFYGWRIPMLDKFRNAISIKELKSGESVSKPIFSYVFYFLVLVSFAICLAFVRSKFSKDF